MTEVVAAASDTGTVRHVGGERLAGRPLRIAVLSQYFMPESFVKFERLIPALVARGHQVEVLTGIPNLPHGRYHEGYRARWAQEDRLDGLRVIRSYVWPYRGRSAWKRILNYCSFALSAAVNARRLSAFDLLYVYHPPLTIALPALWISRRRKVPFLYDVQDIWPEAGLAAGAVKMGMMYRAMASLARAVYRRAAVITVIAPAFRDLIVGQGVAAAKVHVVPNWTDEDVYYPRDRGDSRSRYGLPADAFIVMYAGNMGSSHGVDTVLEAAQILATDPRIHFVFQGSGPEYDHMAAAARARNLANVSFQGYFPDRADIPQFLAAADVMVVHLKKSPAGAVSLPHRLLAYMACARPMIVASEGAPRDLVEEVGCGVACEPEQPAAIAERIREMAAHPDRLREMGAKGRAAYVARYSEAASLARAFEAIDAAARQIRLKPDPT